MDARYRIARGITVKEVKEKVEKDIPNDTLICKVCSKPIKKKGFIIQSNFGVIDVANPAIFSILYGSQISCTIFHFNCFLQKCIDIAKGVTKYEGVSSE